MITITKFIYGGRGRNSQLINFQFGERLGSAYRRGAENGK
jgi:hypothetical protein